MENEKYYYQIAREASREIGNHQGLLYIQNAAKHAQKILDLGCGEGTRLNTLLDDSNKSGQGIDIDAYAINLAKKQYPHHQFQTYDGKQLPYKSNSFDLVYTAFVLEHTTDHKQFLSEAMRVTKQGGLLIILCPNFGAPNRRSPNSQESPLKKLIRGVVSDLLLPGKRLGWQSVEPKTTYHSIDDDTTVEPYLRTLINFLVKRHFQIQTYSSLWPLESPSLNPRKLLFKYLGVAEIYPFKHWGPQIFVATRKLI